jgi:hypothetical protein
VIEESTEGGLDFLVLRDAIEGKDPEVLIGFYSEDAELRIVNATLPEGPAFELKGRSQIERYLRAVCDQQMGCCVEGEPDFGEGSISFGQVCEYPDRARISVRTTLEVAEGLIERQTDVVERARSDDAIGGERLRL